MLASNAHLAKKIFGSANDRLIKKLEPAVERINRLEPELALLVRCGSSRAHG